MVSHPENGSDSPIGSDRDRGRDRFSQASLEFSSSKVVWLVRKCKKGRENEIKSHPRGS